MTPARPSTDPGRPPASGPAARLPLKARPRPGATFLIGLALILSGPGCASYRPGESGFLGDYSRLEKDPIHLNWGLGLERARSQNAPPGLAGGVDSFYIEPVRWMVDESSRAGGDADRRQALTSALDRALREQLGAIRPIVDRPGPGTATVRSAITTVMLSRPLLNAALLATAVTPVFIGPIFNGGARVEAEVIGPDGRRLSAVTVASGGGILDIVGYFGKWRHAAKAMRRSAIELRETLEP